MNLTQYIQILEQQGELIRIREFVDPVLEIAEITDRYCKQPGGGKALLFENTGTIFPVLTNAMGSTRRICTALGVDQLDDAAVLIEQLFKDLTAPGKGLGNKIRLLSELGRVASWMPAQVKGKGTCQEVIHMKPDLGILPVLKCWPADGGRFVTLPMVHTVDPDSGIRNVGMYRMQVLGPVTTGMHWHRHKTGARHYQRYKELGKPMPVAVALGGDPAYIYSSTAPLPENIDEYILAGFLRKKKVRMVRCITQDICIPDDADIVIEGYVDPQEELVWEGPFGDHTGFYSLADWYPQFHVTCITHRKDAVYPATIVGIPPQEDVFFAKATERIFLAPIKMAILPEMENMDMPEPGVAHNLALIQIRKTYPGQGYKTVHSLWGAGQMMFNKFLLVTDLPLGNYLDLTRQVLQRIDLHTDLIWGKGPLDVLDHSSPHFAFGSKLGIDATSKWPEEGATLPENITNGEMPGETYLQTTYPSVTEWNFSLVDISIPVVVIAVKNADSSLSGVLGRQLLADDRLSRIKLFILLDEASDIYNLYMVSWLICSNTDPVRDIRIADKPRQQLVIDACFKLKAGFGFEREWPNVVTASEETIRAIDQKWDKLGLGPVIISPSVNFMKMKKGDGAVAG